MTLTAAERDAFASYKPSRTPQRRWKCPKCKCEGWSNDGALRPHQHYSRFGWECNGETIRKYKPGE